MGKKRLNSNYKIPLIKEFIVIDGKVIEGIIPFELPEHKYESGMKVKADGSIGEILWAAYNENVEPIYRCKFNDDEFDVAEDKIVLA